MQDFASDCIHVETPALRFPLQRHVALDSDFWADRIPELPGHKLRGFDGVQVWAQLVARDAGDALDLQNSLGRHSLSAMKPHRYVRLPYAEFLSELCLRSRRLNRFLKSKGAHCACYSTESDIEATTHSVIYFNENICMPKAGKTSEFWERLAETLGEDLPMHQETAAKKLGLWQSAVSKWKLGNGLPQLWRAVEIASKWGVCVEWLLSGRGPKYPHDTSDSELTKLLRFWNELTSENKQEILSFAAFKRSMQPSSDSQPSSEKSETTNPRRKNQLDRSVQ